MRPLTFNLLLLASSSLTNHYHHHRYYYLRQGGYMTPGVYWLTTCQPACWDKQFQCFNECIIQTIWKPHWTDYVHYKWLEAKTSRPKTRPDVFETKATIFYPQADIEVKNSPWVPHICLLIIIIPWPTFVTYFSLQCLECCRCPWSHSTQAWQLTASAICITYV